MPLQGTDRVPAKKGSYERRIDCYENIVCIKQVPDTVEVKIDPKTGTLIRDGVPSIIKTMIQDRH